ncbi:MAG: sulfatase-like hydrolase/transferase, partial [Pseudomonadota bacterium]
MRGPLFLLALLFAVAACSPPASETETSSEVSSDESTSAERPNFLIVIADDLGWSDLGAFGGEINTPNLDSIAARGRLLTDFYVAPTCSPTRSMLMTGVSNHAAGIGAMHHMAAPNQTTINYAGQLHDGVVTFTEVLQASGY